MFVLILTLAIIAICICLLTFRLRIRNERQGQQQKNAEWLIRNDEHILGVVLVLSHLPIVAQELNRKEKRKKLKLILELRKKVKSHLPDADRERVREICKNLLLISVKIRNSR